MKISGKLKSLIKKRILEQIKSPEAREVVIRTPFKMGEDELQGLKIKFPKLESARLINEVDHDLIGGLVIVDGSMIFDYSIKGKMNDIVDTLLD